MSIKKTFVYEFAGMPKSGKTTVIEIVSQYFRRRNIDVNVHKDAGTYAPIGKDNIGALNIYLACQAAENLLECTHGKYRKFSLLLIDRGIFDRCVFSHTLNKLGHVSDDEMDDVNRFLLMPILAKSIDKVFVFLTSTALSLKRELDNSLSSHKGKVMNDNFLEEFRKSSLSLVDKFGYKFNSVTLIDTERMNNRIKETARQIVIEIEKQLWAEGQLSSANDLRFDEINGIKFCKNSEASTHPLYARVEGSSYYRYMDQLYINKQPSELNINEVVALCDARIDKFDEIVDENLNKVIVSSLIEFVSQKYQNKIESVIDFGCGSGLSMSYVMQLMPGAFVFGVDPSAKAINIAQQKGLVAEKFDSKSSFTEKNFFDLAISVFVMHFNIPKEDLIALRRSVKAGSYFVFNLYNEHEDHINKMGDCGWSAATQIHSAILPNNHRMYYARAI